MLSLWQYLLSNCIQDVYFLKNHNQKQNQGTQDIITEKGWPLEQTYYTEYGWGGEAYLNLAL